MEEIICMVCKSDGQPLASFLKDKLESEKIGIKTDIQDVREVESCGPCTVTVFLITPEFIDHGDLRLIQNFEQTDTVLVLVGIDTDELRCAALKINDEVLLDFLIYRLEETDESMKGLLISIIDMYETNTSLSEKSSEDDETTRIAKSGKIDYEKSASQEQHYKKLPDRTSGLFNAVKHVFIKNDDIFLLVEDYFGENLTVKFHEATSSVNAVYIDDVHSYVFKWTGTAQETFSVNFKEEEVGNGTLDAVNGFNSETAIASSRPNSSGTQSVTSLGDDIPYDTLPERSGQQVSDSLPSKNSVVKKADDNTTILPHFQSEETKEKQCTVTDTFLDQLQTTKDDSFDHHRDFETGTFDDSTMSQSSSTESLKQCLFTNKTSSFSDSVVVSNEGFTSSPSTETLTSSPRPEVDPDSDLTTKFHNTIDPLRERLSETDSKLHKLRCLLEEELAQVNAVFQTTNYHDDNEVILRPHAERSPSTQTATERSTVCSTIEEELPLPDDTEQSSVLENDEPPRQLSIDKEKEERQCDDKPTVKNDAVPAEESTDLSIDEIPETIIKKSDSIKDNSSAQEAAVENPGKYTKKHGFSFKQQIKKMMHRSNSEPKMRGVVDAAQKAKVFKSYSHTGIKEILSHSASAGVLQGTRQSQPEDPTPEKCKKKGKGKKLSTPKLQRKPSVRIQRVLEDKNIVAPALPLKPAEHTD